MLSELMGLRFSGGADEIQVRRAVAAALVRHINHQVSTGELSAADASKTALQQYHTLIRRPKAEQTTEEQVSFLLDIQTDLSHRDEGSKILLFVCKDLYDLEVFAEESFLHWWGDDRSTANGDMSQVRESISQFIDWLKTADSERGEDESEDEDGEDEDEDED